VNGTRGTFILDTGASYVAVKSGFAERAKIPQSSLNITLSTANGLARGQLSKADKIRLGHLEAANVPTVVQKLDDRSYGAGIDGLLGMSFLSRFEVQMGSDFIEIRTRRPK
jgi:aspartyl protease family protein